MEREDGDVRWKEVMCGEGVERWECEEVERGRKEVMH